MPFPEKYSMAMILIQESSYCRCASPLQESGASTKSLFALDVNLVTRTRISFLVMLEYVV